MNKKTTWFLLFLAVGITFASCKKEDPIPPAPTNTELLTKIWKVDQALIDSMDYTAFYTGVRFDFRANNTAIFTIPGQSPDTISWAFNAAETQLITIQDGERDTVSILTLTAAQLKVRGYDPIEEEETILTMSPAL